MPWPISPLIIWDKFVITMMMMMMMMIYVMSRVRDICQLVHSPNSYNAWAGPHQNQKIVLVHLHGAGAQAPGHSFIFSISSNRELDRKCCSCWMLMSQLPNLPITPQCWPQEMIFLKLLLGFFFNFLECFPIDLPKIRTESEIVSVDLSLLYSELSIICPHFPFLKPFNLNKWHS